MVQGTDGSAFSIHSPTVPRYIGALGTSEEVGVHEEDAGPDDPARLSPAARPRARGTAPEPPPGRAAHRPDRGGEDPSARDRVASSVHRRAAGRRSARLHRVEAAGQGVPRGGGSFAFATRLEGLVTDAGPPSRVRALATSAGEIPCDAVFLAPGHSARDTWAALAAQGVAFEAKPFQLGVRIEHPQELITRGRYGDGPEAGDLFGDAGAGDRLDHGINVLVGLWRFLGETRKRTGAKSHASVQQTRKWCRAFHWP